ncbi:MAG TPA: PEP-CTERM sorting domain-containing protein [Candidatus Eisenbacteria bacterium]|nr:PEP-CTERM sorting domain-containing protein [Candidatus Eisenbacteria bacterium]
MKRLGFALLCIASLALLPAAAKADSFVDWTLSGSFSDGGAVSGTFTLDATTGAITAFDVATTAGSVLGAYTYDATNTVASYITSPGEPTFPDTLDFSSGTSPIYDLQFAIGALSATGGAVTIFTVTSNCPGSGSLGGCSSELVTTAHLGDNGCINDGSSNVRCLVSGTLSGTVEGSTGGNPGDNGGGNTDVPEPSSLLLTALGFAAFALKRG